MQDPLQVIVGEFADEVLVGERCAQDRIGQFGLDEAISIHLGVVAFQEQIVIGAQFAPKAGDSQHVDCASMTTERRAGDDQRRMPIEDAPLFHTRRERWVGKIYPIQSAELYRIVKGESVWGQKRMWH